MKKIRLTETDLIKLIKKVINGRGRLNEQGQGFNCEGACECVTPVFGTGMYQTIQDCENDTDNCCGGKGKGRNHGVRRQDLDMAKRRPNSSKYTDMRGGRLNEQSSGVVTMAMIQQCKHHLNNIQGTNAAWKSNFKSMVLGKSCMWVRTTMGKHSTKMSNSVTGSGKWYRSRAKVWFLECLLGLCNS